MTTISQRLENAATIAEEVSDQHYRVLNGGEDESVAVDLGEPIPTVRKVQAQIRDEFTGDIAAARQEADRATAQKQLATQERVASELAASKSEQHEQNAAAVVTGGEGSLTPEPGKLPIGDSEGHIAGGWFAPHIRDSYRHAVESATGGRNTVLYDAHGNANVMVVIPKFTYDDIGMTDTMGSGTVSAFIKNGVEVPEVFVAKYLASGNQAVSAANVDPRTSINFDPAKAACEAKGPGWHLMSVHEWAALALWCVVNGYQPRGNTQYGRSHELFHEFGRRGDGRLPNDREGSARTNTGTGPASWAHDGTDGGVYDLVGNVHEWQDQLKMQDGRIICTTDNDFTLLEAQWQAQACFIDSPATGDGEGASNLGAPFLNSAVTNHAGTLGDNGHYDHNQRVDWKNMAVDASYVSSELMKRLLIEPAGHDIQGQIYARNYGERLPIRGGIWSDGSSAGLGCLSLHNHRSYSASRIGFRPAFVA